MILIIRLYSYESNTKNLDITEHFFSTKNGGPFLLWDPNEKADNFELSI